MRLKRVAERVSQFQNQRWPLLVGVFAHDLLLGGETEGKDAVTCFHTVAGIRAQEGSRLREAIRMNAHHIFHQFAQIGTNLLGCATFQRRCSLLRRNEDAPLRDEVQRDIRQSSSDFVRVVWPVVQEHCPELHGSALRVVEGRMNNPIAYELDVCAGIDAYQRTSLGLRGMISRVQWGTDYQTFTVRIKRPNGAPTEYMKRLTTIKHLNEGFLYPYWTIQAYVEKPGGKLLSVAAAKTVELYRYIEQRKHSGRPCHEHPAANGGERFLAVEWDQYSQTGNYLFVYLDLVPPA